MFISDGAYAEVKHFPPYTGNISTGIVNMSSGDRVGVITTGQNPQPIKDKYFNGVVPFDAPLIIYEVGRDRISLAHIVVGGGDLVTINPHEIRLVTKEGAGLLEQSLIPNIVTKVTEEVRRFGEVKYSRRGNVYQPMRGSNNRMLVEIEEIIPVSQQIEEMLAEILTRK